jgi:hypothetical protein
MVINMIHTFFTLWLIALKQLLTLLFKIIIICILLATPLVLTIMFINPFILLFYFATLPALYTMYKIWIGEYMPHKFTNV